MIVNPDLPDLGFVGFNSGELRGTLPKVSTGDRKSETRSEAISADLYRRWRPQLEAGTRNPRYSRDWRRLDAGFAAAKGFGGRFKADEAAMRRGWA
jgi:hypothetical protein